MLAGDISLSYVHRTYKSDGRFDGNFSNREDLTNAEDNVTDQEHLHFPIDY